MLAGLKPSDTGGPAGFPGLPPDCGCPPPEGVALILGALLGSLHPSPGCVHVGPRDHGRLLSGVEVANVGPETYIQEPSSHMNGFHGGVTLSPPASDQPWTRGAAHDSTRCFCFHILRGGWQKYRQPRATRTVPRERGSRGCSRRFLVPNLGDSALHVWAPHQAVLGARPHPHGSLGARDVPGL